MTTSVPAYLTWPLLTIMVTVVLTRYLFFNSNQYESYLNHTLAYMVTSNLLRERTIEDALSRHGILTITTAQQLSLAVMIFAAAEFMGFVTLWSRLPARRTRRRHRYHRLAAATLALGFLVAATPARRAGQTLERHGGWSSVIAWSLVTAMFIAISYRLLCMTVSETRGPNVKPRERLLAAGGLFVGLAVGSTSIDAVILAALEELGWLHTIAFREFVHGSNIFWQTAAVSAIAAVPAVKSLSARIGLDSTSRRWRQLQPLRTAMTRAVPAAVFELHVTRRRRRKTPLDLHQTTVQIRDAVLQLRDYFPDITPGQASHFISQHNVPTRQRPAAILALQLAYAINAKTAGAAPTPVDTTIIPTSRSTNLEQETNELRQLARWWRHASRHHHPAHQETTP